MDLQWSYPEAATTIPCYNYRIFSSNLRQVLQNYDFPFDFGYNFMHQKCNVFKHHPNQRILRQLFSMVIWNLCNEKPNGEFTRDLRKFYEIACRHWPRQQNQSQKWYQTTLCAVGVSVFCLESRCMFLLGKRSKRTAHKHLCVLPSELRRMLQRPIQDATYFECEIIVDFF